MSHVLRRIPRDQRFALGARMQSLITEVMEMLTEAYYSPPLAKVNIRLEILRHYLRLCYEIG
ncbi:MAG: four helix bundle protein [Cytophagales bacterium]|nr:four helix bundle protein [Cytophagales bacterium]